MAAQERTWLKPLLIGVAVVAGLAALVVGEVVLTAPVRRSLQTYAELITAANRQDLAAARRLCSAHYLNAHALKPAPEGGLIGLPRNIHTNFQAWRHGANVWICPSNRVGPVYQFVYEDGGWKFDGPIGLLRPRGVMEPMPEIPDGPESESRLPG